MIYNISGKIVEKHEFNLFSQVGERRTHGKSGSGGTPMHYATYYGRESIVELLLRMGSQALDSPTNKYKRTPIHL